MSRSFRHTPITGHGHHSSEKEDKRIANRSMRHTNRIRVLYDKEPLIMDEVMDVWSMSKDGKMKMFRTDKKEDWYIKAMRK